MARRVGMRVEEHYSGPSSSSKKKPAAKKAKPQAKKAAPKPRDKPKKEKPSSVPKPRKKPARKVESKTSGPSDRKPNPKPKAKAKPQSRSGDAVLGQGRKSSAAKKMDRMPGYKTSGKPAQSKSKGRKRNNPTDNKSSVDYAARKKLAAKRRRRKPGNDTK